MVDNKLRKYANQKRSSIVNIPQPPGSQDNDTDINQPEIPSVIRKTSIIQPPAITQPAQNINQPVQTQNINKSTQIQNNNQPVQTQNQPVTFQLDQNKKSTMGSRIKDWVYEQAMGRPIKRDSVDVYGTMVSKLTGREYEPVPVSYDNQATPVYKNEDRYAAYGAANIPGYTFRPYNQIMSDRQLKQKELELRNEDHKRMIESFDYAEQFIRDYKLKERRVNELKSRNNLDNDEQLELKKSEDYLINNSQNYSAFKASIATNSPDSTRLNQARRMRDKAEQELNRTDQEIQKYNLASQYGKQMLDEKQKGMLQQTLANIGNNAERNAITASMANTIGFPEIGTGINAGSIEGGLNKMFSGSVKVSPSANEWTKTRVGDRGFVDAIVNVRPSGVVAPLGVPGSIRGSDIQNRFEFKTPLRQIGVGDVQAKPGFRIGIEDVKRKKQTVKPNVKRNSKPLITKPVSVNNILSNIEVSTNKINNVASNKNQKKAISTFSVTSIENNINNITRKGKKKIKVKV